MPSAARLARAARLALVAHPVPAVQRAQQEFKGMRVQPATRGVQGPSEVEGQEVAPGLLEMLVLEGLPARRDRSGNGGTQGL